MVVEEIAAHINSLGLATLGTDLFMHVSPDEPDELTVVTEYAGDEPDFVQDALVADTENSRIQVAVRSTQPEVGRLLAEQIYQAMMGIRNDMLSGTRILWCRPSDTPAMIGRDDSGRFLTTVNFRVKKELSSV
jgi:hypothetical protein